MTHPSKSPASDADEARFLQQLARGLHVYGLPSHRLEEALHGMAHSLRFDAQFLVTPTAVICSFGNETRLMRVDQGETHLERLTELDQIMTEVRAGQLTARSAADRVESITTQPERYGTAPTLLAFAVASGSAALFFGGGWRESVSAAAIGLLIGGLTMVGGLSRRVARLLPTLSGFVAAMVAHGLATQFDPMFPFLSTLAGLILLIPGLSLTIAMSELAHHHLVSGTARLMGALITFLQLGFGTAVGWKLAPSLLGTIADRAPAPLPEWTPWATLPVAALSFVVLFRAHPRDYVAILLGSTAAYAGSRFGSQHLGPEVGKALGAWLLGCTSTVLAKVRRRPSATALVPGLLLLVPGTLGIRSLQALFSKDVPLGIETGFTMALIAISLVTGLFLANVTLRPRQF